MKKSKMKSKTKGVRKKKSFLENQKKYKQNLKRAAKDPAFKVDDTRFRFENFSSQVSGIEGSIVYQLAGRGNIQVDADSSASVLSETLSYWKEMNLSAQFQELDKKLTKFTSLTQVIFNQKEIIAILSEYLPKGTVLSLQPMLELLAALATDLQQEFCPYLNSVLELLMSGPFTIRDANVIKWSLKCLGHLMKTLWRPISHQLGDIYKICEQLMNKSRPDYIRYLSAETLAFLLRKTGDKEKFLDEILSFDEEVIDPVAVAKLMFESIKTVNEQFNVHCSKLWPLFVRKLLNRTDILEKICEFCAEHSSKDHIEPLIKVVIKMLNEVEGDKTDDIKKLLQCVIIFVRFKSGKLIKDTDLVPNIFETRCIESAYKEALISLAEIYLKAEKIFKTPDQNKNIVEKVLSNSNVTLTEKLDFVTSFFEHPIFDGYILKPYFSLIQNHIDQDFSLVIQHLSSLITTLSPLPSTGDQLRSWTPPVFDLMIVQNLRSLSNKEKFSNIILSKVDENMSAADLRYSLVCLSSLRPVSRKELSQRIAMIASTIISSTERERLSILPILIMVLHKSLPAEESISDHIKLTDVLNLFLKNSEAKEQVQVLNFVLSSQKEAVEFEQDKVKELLVILQSCLSNPDGEVRTMCLQTMITLMPSFDKQVLKFHNECQMSLLDVFKCLLSAENATESLGTYKDKLNTLERVAFHRISKAFQGFEFLSVGPLHYLIGLLHTNFTLLWSPVMDLIGSYGNEMKREIFWPVFSEKLVKANTDIENLIDNIKRRSSSEDSLRIDHISYRNHLWEVMGRFHQLAEAKNREIVPMFLDNFMKREYLDIRTLADDKEVELEHKSVIQSTVKSLLSHLNVFVKFLDLKSLHRSSELKELVHSFLCHKLASVQKVALDILVAYKLKYLLPYKENLSRLLEEKDFKSELLAFPLGGEDSQIQAEHRKELMPVILRLLYGRMRAVKAGGRKKGSKGNVNARRGLILQNMMELSEEEMMIFFDLVFKDLFTGSNIKKGDCVFQYIISNNECPSKTTKQLQACIEMMQVILSKMGKLLDTSLTYLASVIIWMGFIIHNLEYSDNVRSVRNSLYSLLATFYNKYTSFTWSDSATEAMLKVFVWNILPKFETDFIHSSSGLIQILLSWSKCTNYHHLFDKLHPETSSSRRILENICKVLLRPSTNSKLVLSILTIIHNLVVIEDENAMDEDESSSTKLGVETVLKEMEIILDYFQIWIRSSNENVKNINKVGIKLDILMTLAPNVTSAETSLQLFKQLLTMSNNLKKPESVLKVLTISKLLVGKIEKQEIPSLVNDLIPFYGRVATRNERLELSSVIENCALLEPSMKLVSEFCTDLNSFDKKRIEEPDFERRMKVFRRVREFVKEDSDMTLLELSSVIYNCCFFLKHETESSLKANSLEALNSVSKIMLKMSKTDQNVSKVLIDKICLDHIKNGVKNKDDSIRCDFLSFLQSLVTNCSEASARLKDLTKLIDVDPDSNILENLRHVQLHRRGRAMAKLATCLETDTNYIKTKNLTQIFLPMAGSYLLNDSFAKNSDLVDQAISLVKSIAGSLPWAQYEHSVKYYIEMFTKDTQHQKQLVKITSAVLDAFHFEVGDMFENSKKPSKDDTNEGKTKEEIQKSKIFWTVNNVLLPKLHGTLSGKTKGPTSISDEDKLILRVPLAIPIIKMLKILSGKLLFRQVPGIVNKIVSFLKSKAIEIREAARSTLCSVIELLGPRYLSFVLKEMSSNLTRGYLQHILTFTSHSLLCRLSEKDMLSSGDVDNIVPLVTDMALTEMFSAIAEEKEVRKITGKLMEARGSKCYDTLQIMAKYISNDQLFNLAKPFADKATELSTFKNLQKIRESFRNLVLGLLDNKSLDSVGALIFIYGIVMDKLNIGNNTKKQINSLKKEENTSIFIVPVAPKRAGVAAKNSQSASQYIVHEFGLNLLYFLLKRGSLESSEELHCSRLEPFIDILISSLSSSHVSLITTAVRCLIWLVKFPLTVLDRAKVLEITNKVFDLLNKFGGGTDGKGENHDLVVIASKLLVILIRDVELTTLDQNHLKTILTYVVNDVMDPFKATTAFGLLNAILNRRLETDTTELHDVIVKMIELSIQSTNIQTRQAARSTVVNYVKNYNLKKKLVKILELYCAQLGYEHEFGRLSAAESLKLLITNIGAGTVDNQASFIFISLAPHLVNDESSSCRKSISGTLSTLLKSVSPPVGEKLLQSTMTWYKSPDNLSHTQLACHLLTIFTDTLPTAPYLTSKVDNILLHLPNCLSSSSDMEDHLTIQALTLLSRMFQNNLLSPSSSNVTPVWQRVHTCLLHSHTWARVLSAQLLGLYLSNVTAENISNHVVKKTKNVWIKDVGTVKSLVLDSIEQLSLVSESDNDLGTQIIKNLVALTRVTLVNNWETILDTSEDKLTFAWIVRKCLKVANQELISSPNTTTKRVFVFNFVAACCLGTDRTQVENILRIVLPPLHRAVSGQSGDLKQHCQEVLDLIKSQVDEDKFSEVYLEIQMNLSKQKGERAQSKKQNLILNPEAAAKRKIKINESKKRAKKAKTNK